MRAEQSLGRKVEWSSNWKSRAEWSSDLEVEWNLEQWKCEMGHPLTACFCATACSLAICSWFKGLNIVWPSGAVSKQALGCTFQLVFLRLDVELVSESLSLMGLESCEGVRY